MACETRGGRTRSPDTGFVCYADPVPLFAPAAVPVEISDLREGRSNAGGSNRSDKQDDNRRAFRLSDSVSDAGIVLVHPAPFEIGQPVGVTFSLPDSAPGTALSLRAVVEPTDDDDSDGEHGGRRLTFIDPEHDVRDAIARYVAARLGLPGGQF
jgi:hypothetical protein